MDINRKQYHRVRDFYIAWLDAMNEKLAAIDTDYFDTPGKKAINRINNNLMFQPLKPVYKNHFGAGRADYFPRNRLRPSRQVTRHGRCYYDFG